MPITLGANIASLRAMAQLNRATATVSKSFERLSSGMRINNASDDAAGLSIASALNSSSRVFAQAVRNINDGLSYLNIADGALAELSNVSMRQIELAQQAATGVYSSSQRQKLDLEAQALVSEFNRIIDTTEFNDRRIFTNTENREVRIQAGYGLDGSIAFSIGDELAGIGVITGDGTFGAAVSFSAGLSAAKSLAVGDLNGDGNIDIIAGSGFAPAQYFVRLGTGTGSFGAATSYDAEGLITNTASLADLNGDGKLDLISGGLSGSGGEVTVRLGAGDGTFLAATSYIVSASNVESLQIVDVNNDGKMDVIAAGQHTTDGYFSVQLGVGDGTLGAVTRYQTESASSHEVAVRDINGDGKLDVITGGQIDGGGGRTNVRLGAGDGTFGAAVSYVAEELNALAIGLADLNSDGIIDMLTGGSTPSSGGYITLRLGVGDGTFSGATSYSMSPSGQVSSLSLADLNGDGKLDVVANTEAGGNGYAAVRLGLGDGTFSAITSYLSEQQLGMNVTLADLNDDNALDIITSGSSDTGVGAVTVRLANTTTLQGSNGGVLIGALPISLSTRDDALSALEDLQQQLRNISAERGVVGSFQSRLEVALNAVESTRLEYKTAESRIRDADIASESSRLLSTQILQQTASAVLSQANRQPLIVLQLLRD